MVILRFITAAEVRPQQELGRERYKSVGEIKHKRERERRKETQQTDRLRES